MNVAKTIKMPASIRINYSPGTYVKEFDGWRGVGISFVVLAHYIPRFFIGSWVFMEMFFVMSGFLITGILMDSKSKVNYYRNFIGRRVVRVFPLYYLCLIILFFLIPNKWLDLSYYRAKQAWFWLYIENWLYALDGWPKARGLHHFWSLAIEEQFYLTWPFFVSFFSSKGLLRFSVFLFFFSILFRNVGMHLGFVMPFPYVATFSRMEGITLGAMIAILVRTDKYLLEKYVYPVTIVSGIVSAMGFVLARSMSFQHPVHYTFNYTFVDLFFAGMITLTMCDDQLVQWKRLLNTKLFKQLGIMSYCLYIFHYPIQNLIEYNYLGYIQQHTGSENLSKLICVMIAFVITIPFVYLVHKKIEVPCWKLKKYF
jgi:peptidoglycan/LPS O-acetylase OafA/YrhL